MSVVHGENGCRPESAGRSFAASSLYDGHLVRREHFERVALGRATLNNQGHWADEGRGNLCTTKHTKSTKVSENKAMDVVFQSSCSSCPSWLLELSSVVNARIGEYACPLYRVLRADDGQDVRRTWGERMSA